MDQKFTTESNTEEEKMQAVGWQSRATVRAD